MPGGQANRLRQLCKRKPLLGLRHRLEYAVLLAVAWTIPKLPRWLVLALSRRLGWVAFWVDARGRQIGLENLRVAVEQGGLELGQRTAEQVLLACYQNFARGFLDLFWFTRLAPDQIDRWVEFENEDQEPAQTMLRNDRGAIFLTPHYGVFEWASLMIGCRGMKLNIIAQDFKNPALTEILRRARQSTGHQVLSRDGAMLKLLRVVKRGGNIALLPDLTVPPQGAATVVKVFGVPTCMTAAHVEIARRCQAPMFVTICEPLADGRARLRVLDVITPTEHATGRKGQAAQAQRVWDHFEAAVRQRPELWLWMYRHWRYRPLDEEKVTTGRAGSPASDCYKFPDYAQEAAAFDSLYRHKAG